MPKKKRIELIINEKYLSLIKENYKDVYTIYRNQNFNELIVIEFTLNNPSYKNNEFIQEIFDLGWKCGYNYSNLTY